MEETQTPTSDTPTQTEPAPGAGQPALGDIVVYSGLHSAEAHAAIVTHVHDTGTVDLYVFEKYPGNGVARTKVPYSAGLANHTYRRPLEYAPSGLR